MDHYRRITDEIRDVVVLNTTASRLETQQSTDTEELKEVMEILSVENSSDTSVLSINTSTPSVTITGDITTIGAFSGSLASTAILVELILQSYR